MILLSSLKGVAHKAQGFDKTMEFLLQNLFLLHGSFFALCAGRGFFNPLFHKHIFVKYELENFIHVLYKLEVEVVDFHLSLNFKYVVPIFFW